MWNNIFNNEDIKTRKAAAKALAKRKSGNVEWGDKFAEYCLDYPVPEVRVVMFEGILTGWPTHSVIEKFISINRHSPHHLLRFMSIKGKVLNSTQDKKDLDELIFLGSGLSNIPYEWESEISQTILKGWEGNKKVKKECLKAIEKTGNLETIYQGIAWEVLLYKRDRL